MDGSPQSCITTDPAFLAKPLRIGIRAVELVARLVEFELACLTRFCRLRHESRNLRMV
jgi:hypothetical protein